MRHNDMSGVDVLREIGLPLLVVIAGYFLPTIIAFARGHFRRWTVLFLNVILGWTGVMWIYLLLMALDVV